MKEKIIEYLHKHGCGMGFSDDEFAYLLHHESERPTPEPSKFSRIRKDDREHYRVYKYMRGESFYLKGEAIERFHFMPNEFELWLDLLLDDSIVLFTYRSS